MVPPVRMSSLRFQRIIAAIALFALLGGPKGIVQCYAWGMMLYERTSESSFAEALQSTFSGEEPCEICVALGNTADSSAKAQVPPSHKLELLSPANTKNIVPQRRVIALLPLTGPDPNSPENGAPPVPPPRLA